jgi:GntR family transcriptional regulator
MRINIDPYSGEAIYRQIVEQIKFMSASGALAPGYQLPSIRNLARDLGINPRTVVRAYEELEHAGLVVSRQGQGVFISTGPEALPSQTRAKLLAQMSERLLAEAMRIGASIDEVLEAIRKTADQMKEKP